MAREVNAIFRRLTVSMTTINMMFNTVTVKQHSNYAYSICVKMGGVISEQYTWLRYHG